nr:isoform short of conserved oligomeric golgi complex subunit 6 [Quercus suber]
MGCSTVGLAPRLSRKLKKVLECRTDSPDLLSSLNTLSLFYTENTPQSLRNLRYTIETHAFVINREFIRASDPAQRALDRVVEKKSFLEKILVYSPWPREIQQLHCSTIFFICWSLLSLSTSKLSRSRRSSAAISSSSLSSEHLQSKFAFEIG